jgi:hypothetical protein
MISQHASRFKIDPMPLMSKADDAAAPLLSSKSPLDYSQLNSGSESEEATPETISSPFQQFMDSAFWNILYIVVYFFGGMHYYMYMQGWTAIDSFYFICITITTTGYGDEVPTTESSRAFSVVINLMIIVSINYIYFLNFYK